jgi:hypothetical protein
MRLPPFASRSLRRQDRGAYLATLVLLQAALLVDVAPALAIALTPLASVVAGEGWPSVVRAAGCVLALAGTSIVLAFPTFALARHARRGRLRFLGLPRLGTGLASAGASIYAAAQTLAIAGHWRPGLIDAATAGACGAMAAGCIALMAAGVLTAELFRRSVAPMRVPIAPWHCRPVLVEVIEPSELATRAA